MTLPGNASVHPLPTVPGYAIVEELYSGCHTAVYRAMRVDQQHSVVIKVLQREYPSFGELVQFCNQYTIAKNLPIAGIVHPLRLELLGRGYALVMEDWGGVSLQKYIQQQSLELAEVLAIALQLADILHDLSQHRVVHKDIKPANILIHPESKQIKLIDFSIASLLPKETQEIQSLNILEGTLAYLAPEQTGRMNRGIDYRTDFYNLGATLYQLLTGTLPFASDDPLELMHCHIAKIPVPVNQIKTHIPAMVAAIVSKLMAKNAEDRYQSAMGLKHDLEQCLTQWKNIGEIAEFELGMRDWSDRFLIPEKLYGREAEVKTLLNAFDRVADGASELMLVAGFSGIGKTAVVNEVHKPIVRQRGYFIKGKYDQFNRNTPLSALVQALRDLIGQLLSESDIQLSQWQAKILAAVGDSGQVLIEVFPELEQIIGKQPSVAELAGSAAQNRFNLLLQRFIEVFTTAEHPLVMFLDDLQWADSASLQLIKLLMNDNGYLLMLGAYRDNEVSPIHPLILAVEELQKSTAIVNTITLAPLAFQDTNHLIADTLNCSMERSQPLTQLIDRKTQGNPFFTTQFLKALHEDQHIIFNRDRCCWECDVAQVNALSLTGDVVEFMAQQLQKLPSETQQALQLAACVGNQFDLATLAIISEQSPNQVAPVLWNALQEGLILPTSQVYKFFQFENTEQTDIQDTANPTYRFLHDRIQQAAYLLIPDNQKKETHLKIGRRLLKNIATTEQHDPSFEIVNHLNTGAELITDLSEKLELANLNLMAGHKAKASTAYDTAVGYLKMGVSLLPLDCWRSCYELTLKLHIEKAESEYLAVNFLQATETAQAALNHARNLLDQVSVYELQMQIHIAQLQMLQAIEIGLHTLEKLDIPLAVLTGEKGLVVDLPELANFQDMQTMTDPYKLSAMQILKTLCAPVFMARPEIFPQIIITMVNLCIEHGNSELSSFAYGFYGLLLSGIGELDNGYQSGQIALHLLERFDAKELKAKVYNLFNSNIRSWKEHVRNSIVPLQEAVQSGLETGDIEWGGYSAANLCSYLFFSGEDLAVMTQKQKIYVDLCIQIKQDIPIHFSQIWRQLGLNLQGLAGDRTLLVGESFDEAQTLPRLIAAKSGTCLFIFYVAKTILLYQFGKYDQALNQVELATEQLGAAFGFMQVVVLNFYHSLILLALCAKADSAKESQYLQQVAANQEKLKFWASHAPMNNQHRYDLVEAKTAQVLKDFGKASTLYDRAIAGAKTNGYLQEEAIANELAFQFYLDWNKEKIAQDYLINAYYGYARWGAKAKVLDLEHLYPKLLAPILQQRLSLSVTETVFASEASTILQTTKTPTSSAGSTSISATLDLATVLKASQTLSSEIQLDKLLATLLYTVLENAGADRGVLLLPREQAWFIEAVATLDQLAHIQSIPLSSSQEISHILVNTVRRTVQPIVIVDALAHPLLATDPYVLQQQPKSMLCTPILQQGKLVAILYLENHVTVGAFTSDRIELLNFLCAQAAISLENARLYQQAQTYAHQLEQSQLQIVQSEKMASLGNLVAGVAHEINNPIGFLNGSLKNAKDYVQDLLEHLALHQQHPPHPAALIQDHAEDIDLEFLCQDLPKLIDSMTGAIDRIKGISTSLRTFSRTDTDRKVSANLHDGLDSTLLILKYRLKANEYRPAIQVIRDYGELPCIDCYPGQLNQVFMNILANAIDILDEGVQDVSLAELEAKPQKITIQTTLRDQNAIEIRICDNGKGMAEAVKAKIFDHLFTTKSVGKGTGLGLTIARQIVVEKHNGTLEVQSEVGQGAEFLIRLPIFCK